MSQSRLPGYIALVSVTLVWSLPNLFVKYLTQYFDAPTQNACRYLAAMAVLIAVGLLRGRLPFRDRKQAVALIGCAIPSFAYQVAWVYAMYRLYPGMAALLSQSIVLFAAILTYAFVPAERPIIRSTRYLSGVALLLVGSVGVVAANQQLPRAPLLAGTGLMALACLAWAVYSVAISRVVRTQDPVAAFTGAGIYVAGALTLFALLAGDLGALWKAPPAALFALIGSGVLCIGLGHPLYFYSIGKVGVAICSIVILTTPVVTSVLSALLFGEWLTMGQMAFGAMLLLGALIATLADPSLRRRKTPPPESHGKAV